MSQLLRVYKPEICCLIKNYGTQRYKQNHYETLNVANDASQKEIKQAFFKLSKQLHPDIKGKYSHADFVRLNEAYSIIGKANTRRQYDSYLKWNRYNPSYEYRPQKPKYGSRWEYEVRTAGGPWPPPEQKSNHYFGLIVALIFCGLGFVHAIFVLYSIEVRRITILQEARLEHEYQQTRAMTRIKSDLYAKNNLNSKEINERILMEIVEGNSKH